MTSRAGARLAALLAPAALLLPTTAFAQTASYDDGAGDAKALNLADAFGVLSGSVPTEGPMFLDAPAETSADIVRTTIDHAEKRLTLTVQLRDLVDAEGHSVDFRIFTPQGRYSLTAGMVGGETFADFYPGRSGTVVIVSGGTGGTGATSGGGSRPCRTVRARYDLAPDTLTASLPTSCIGSPTWVQVAAGASRIKVTPQGDGSVNLAGFVDDAFRGGVSIRSMGRSPKVRRG